MNIKKVLNITLLKEIFKNFSNSTELSIILLNDIGNIIIEENSIDFCFKFHKANNKTNLICENTYISFQEKIKESKNIIIDYCHGGLLNAYIPIHINESYLGSIVLGQILDSKSRKKELLKNIEKYGFDKEKYTQALNKVKITSKEKFTNNAYFMKNIISIMVELIESKINTEKREKILTTLINSTPDIICFKDGEGRWLEANDSDLELFNLQNVDYRGKTDSELAEYTDELYKDAFLGCEITDQTAWRKRTVSRDIEEIPTIDGNLNIYDVIKVPIFKEGKREGLVVLGRDITSQKKAEEELYKVQQLNSLGVLAGGIAHDFNNILTSILINNDLALTLIKNNQEAHNLIKEAKKASLRAKKLATQLLTFSKGGSPIKEVFNLKNLIMDITNFVLSGTSISVLFNLSEELYVELDKDQFSQVIQNLVLNARESMKDDGKITIKARKIGKLPIENISFLTQDIQREFVEIKIKDTGIGISQENIKRIFEPYFTTKSTGSGLGLAITYSIINKHNGYIKSESVNGKGTTFTIYLPIGNINNQSNKQNQKVDIIEDTLKKNKTILIMDDEYIIRSTTKKLLNYLGYNTITTKNGDETISLYKEFLNKKKKIDLIIMDLTIPNGMGGEKTIKELMKIDKNIKAIVTSGYSNDPIMANYKDYNFISSISKPFTISELNKVLKSIEF